MVVPTIRTERSLLRAGANRVCGMDEVGRGAVAGPVAVGAVVVDLSTGPAPKGLRDSKLLRPAVRNVILPKLRDWCVESAVGYSAASEIDEFGLMVALRLAGLRALSQVGSVDQVILDGSYDWLSPLSTASQHATEPDNSSSGPSGPVVSVSESANPGWTSAVTFSSRTVGPVSASSVKAVQRATNPDVVAPWEDTTGEIIPVTTIVGGDRSCSSVAAASVVAKVDRDSRMERLSMVFPEYGWAASKGYSTAQHLQAIRVHGLCEQHRHSWNLPSPSGSSGR